MSPPSSTAAPVRLKAPAVGLNVMPLNCVRAGKSLLFTRPAVPSNVSVSSATGRVFQLAALFQLLAAAPPPPVQVSVAARARPPQMGRHAAARIVIPRFTFVTFIFSLRKITPAARIARYAQANSLILSGAT